MEPEILSSCSQDTNHWPNPEPAESSPQSHPYFPKIDFNAVHSSRLPNQVRLDTEFWCNLYKQKS
jgi:hypothetical protein